MECLAAAARFRRNQEWCIHFCPASYRRDRPGFGIEFGFRRCSLRGDEDPGGRILSSGIRLCANDDLWPVLRTCTTMENSDPLTILNITQLYDRTRTEAISGFAEVNYDVTDRLTLVGGARYSREKKEQYVSFGVRAFPKVDEMTWSATTPRASIKFKLTDSLNTYLTYSEGFKSGSYNSFSFTPGRSRKGQSVRTGLER